MEISWAARKQMANSWKNSIEMELFSLLFKHPCSSGCPSVRGNFFKSRYNWEKYWGKSSRSIRLPPPDKSTNPIPTRFPYSASPQILLHAPQIPTHLRQGYEQLCKCLPQVVDLPIPAICRSQFTEPGHRSAALHLGNGPLRVSLQRVAGKRVSAQHSSVLLHIQIALFRFGPCWPSDSRWRCWCGHMARRHWPNHSYPANCTRPWHTKRPRTTWTRKSTRSYAPTPRSSRAKVRQCIKKSLNWFDCNGKLLLLSLLGNKLLDFSYRQDAEKAQRLLTCELHSWSNQSCLSLAVAANHRALLAHPCSQVILADLWMGGLRTRKNTNFKVCLIEVQWSCGCLTNVYMLHPGHFGFGDAILHQAAWLQVEGGVATDAADWGRASGKPEPGQWWLGSFAAGCRGIWPFVFNNPKLFCSFLTNIQFNLVSLSICASPKCVPYTFLASSLSY